MLHDDLGGEQVSQEVVGHHDAHATAHLLVDRLTVVFVVLVITVHERLVVG